VFDAVAIRATEGLSPAEREEYEEDILRRAAEAAARRNTKALPAFPEPKRGKAHWDFVLEEMAWMAKEFVKCAPSFRVPACVPGSAARASCSGFRVSTVTAGEFS
jgi:HSA